MDGPPALGTAARVGCAAGVAAAAEGCGLAAGVVVTGLAATGFAASVVVSIGSLILLLENIVSSRSSLFGRVA